MKVCDDASHVVSAYAVFGVWSQDLVEQSLHQFVHIILAAFILYVVFIYPFHALFVREAVPDAVAGKNDKFVCLFALGNCDVWERSDCLVFCLHVGLILVLEIPKGSTESQVAVHSGVLDEVVRVFDSLKLLEVIRLMIFAESNDLVVGKQHRSAVTSI